MQRYLARAIRRHQAGRLDEAAHAYRTVLSNDPQNATALNMLGVLCVQRGECEAGICLLQGALEVDPDFTDAYANLGRALLEVGRYSEATEQLWKAVHLEPDHLVALRHLTRAVRFLEYAEDAPEDICEQQLRAFEMMVAACPEDVEARYMLGALRGDHELVRAPDDFVSYVFDRYAKHYEESLTTLQYRVPRLVIQALERRFPGPAGEFDVLDAGCGTGLCGELLRPWARRMVGVDLSGEMLQLARAKRVYDRLHEAELTAWMRESAERFDLLICTDTLCYFGELGEALRASAGVLRSNGLMLFSLQQLKSGEDGWRITPSGRFSHSCAYVTEAMRAAGLQPLSMDEEVLRLEGGRPVVGLLIAAEPAVPGSG